MILSIYQVDAFASSLFKGNPAAVVPLQQWLEDQQMQQIAAENNLSETAFFIPEGKGFHIRWFTPKAEVSLCGHATLATAHVLFNELHYEGKIISFGSKSGTLNVRKVDDRLQLDFPADPITETTTDAVFTAALGYQARAVYKGRTDYLLLFDSEDIIKAIKPDFKLLSESEARGVIVTAQGGSADFVSRFFAPNVGVNEDPVTGSAHTSLIPFWAQKLHKKQMKAMQLSERGGELWCTLSGDRVLIAGNAVTYLRGQIEI
ncbi:MAG: PhzF family phenazine biosynthesis protein [Methylococcaceae bacterium]|nr:PhzF family phenazine biosynthesis protein [Prolixibacteraceae bacterium]